MRCAKCPAEDAYAAQKMSCNILAFVMSSLQPGHAEATLRKIACTFGPHHAKAIQADMRARIQNENRGA